MKLTTLIASAIFALSGQAFAAVRVMHGSSIIGGKDVVVGDGIYDVDFGYNQTAGWVATIPVFPGPASPFENREQAVQALNAIYNQLVGNGVGMALGYISSIGDYYGFPERKGFGVVQTYGEMIGSSNAYAIQANFQTELLFSANNGPYPSKSSMSIADLGLYTITRNAMEGRTYPVWTLTGSVASVPEPGSYILAGLGFLALLFINMRHRRTPREGVGS